MALIYTFRGILTLQGALHIGSGGGDANTDATIVRDSRGIPYIPGSSVRGAFRAAIERLAPPLLAFVPSRTDDQAFQKMLQEQIEHLRDEAAIQSYLHTTLNSIERLFGTTYWASPLTIPDLSLVAGAPEAQEIRHGVGIDRDTGAAKEQIKYDFEVLPRGHAFHFIMRCAFPSDYETDWQWERLLAIGLRLMEQGELPLGGRVARGVGQVQLQQLEVFLLDEADRSALLSALLSDHPDQRCGTRQPDNWTRRMLKGL